MPTTRTIDHEPSITVVGKKHRVGTHGQAIVEFALVSGLLFVMVFGIVDFGRAIYLSTQLHNAARDGARYGKLHPSATNNIKSTVVASASGFSLSTSDVSVTCAPTVSCTATSSRVTVSVSAPFTALTQEFLGLSPITMTASTSVNVE